MTKVIGSGLLKDHTKELDLQNPIKVEDLPQLLEMRDSLSDLLIVVRDHRKLSDDQYITNGDEIYLFLAAMGG